MAPRGGKSPKEGAKSPIAEAHSSTTKKRLSPTPPASIAETVTATVANDSQPTTKSTQLRLPSFTRLVLEAIFLVLLLCLSLAWWHLRGRISSRDELPEWQDATQLLIRSASVYGASRVGLFVLGKIVGLASTGTRFRGIAVYSGLAAAALGVVIKVDAVTKAHNLVADTVIGGVLLQYLSKQQEYFKGEARFLGRLFVLLLVWELGLWVAMELLRLPFSLLELVTRKAETVKGAEGVQDAGEVTEPTAKVT